MNMRVAHFPGRAPIDAYGHGGFRFAGMSHRGSILLLPSGIYAWNVADAADIRESTLKQLFSEEAAPELLLIGTGRKLVAPPTGLRLACAERGIGIDAMDTGAAVRTYNVLMAEGRSVAAALVAVS